MNCDNKFACRTPHRRCSPGRRQGRSGRSSVMSAVGKDLTHRDGVDARRRVRGALSAVPHGQLPLWRVFRRADRGNRESRRQAVSWVIAENHCDFIPSSRSHHASQHRTLPARSADRPTRGASARRSHPAWANFHNHVLTGSIREAKQQLPTGKPDRRKVYVAGAGWLVSGVGSVVRTTCRPADARMAGMARTKIRSYSAMSGGRSSNGTR
jgi:hypothetical protein